MNTTHVVLKSTYYVDHQQKYRQIYPIAIVIIKIIKISPTKKKKKQQNYLGQTHNKQKLTTDFRLFLLLIRIKGMMPGGAS
jgi:transcriptional regulator of met regulon